MPGPRGLLGNHPWLQSVAAGTCCSFRGWWGTFKLKSANIRKTARCSWHSEQLKKTGDAFCLNSIKQLSKHSSVLNLLSAMTTVKGSGAGMAPLATEQETAQDHTDRRGRAGLEARAAGDSSTGLLPAHTISIVPNPSSIAAWDLIGPHSPGRRDR